MTFSRDFFDADGVIAGSMPGYEVRPQQLQMAEAVEEAITGSRNLIVEAGTGVGKSLAYLVPFIDWAVRENRKVVVSTYTRALQNQLFVKDLPFLKNVLGMDFRYAVCMGARNYVCLRKAGKKSLPEQLRTERQRRQAENILRWLSETESGLAMDMDFVPEESVWNRFSRESDLCLGRKCPHSQRCFYRRARFLQSEAHILITNHSLLFSDMMSDAQVLPEFSGLVLDEAHTLEDTATTHFGKEAGNVRLKYLVDGIREVLRACGDDEKAVEIEKLAEKIDSAGAAFFTRTGEVFGEDDCITQFEKEQFSFKTVNEPVKEMSLLLAAFSGAVEDQERSEEIKAYAQRFGDYARSLEFIFGEEPDKYVYWLTVRKRKQGANYSFHASPVNISDQMKAHLFNRICPVVLTSATLASPGPAGTDFSFVKSRLGLDSCLELLLDSPFDYARNVILHMPRGIADPNADFNGFTRQVRENIIEIYDIMKGRIFVLFTSYAMLHAVADGITGEREDINILKQGDMPRYVLLDVFKKNRNSLLLGTATFWQGVDVPGSSLECVIITKLPFSVPSDPINAARIKSLQEDGRNPFGEYQLPRAVIMFKQGFGRLIRSHSDRGVVVVLDPRIRTRSYGMEFIKALPECRRTDDIREIRDFFV